MKKLTAAELRQALVPLPAWSRRRGAIRREYSFRDFVAAVRFFNRVARRAEKVQHHPDIDVRWNRVILSLTTHDAGGLTQHDIALARACDQFAAQD